MPKRGLIAAAIMYTVHETAIVNEAPNLLSPVAHRTESFGLG